MSDNKLAVANTAQVPALNIMTGEGFEHAQRVLKAICSSNLVPETFRNNIANGLIAYELAQRTGYGIFTVMQNTHVIEGRPGWKSEFIAASINGCGIFDSLEYEYTDLGEIDADYSVWTGPKGNRQKELKKVRVQNIECRAYARKKATNKVVYGPRVSIKMAVEEGWYGKDGSKWKTMPELMLAYRAATFFGRLHVPHLLNGVRPADELEDIDHVELESRRHGAGNTAAEALNVTVLQNQRPIENQAAATQDSGVKGGQQNHDGGHFDDAELVDDDEPLV